MTGPTPLGLQGGIARIDAATGAGTVISAAAAAADGSMTKAAHNAAPALLAYRSQVRPYPHPTSEEAVRRLAAMRGLECGLACAERFHLLRMVRR